MANPTLPASCQQEIEALEAEINIMRSGNPSPEEEAEIIKKEVNILKKYCSKLREVESENEKLKVELGSRVAIKDSEADIGKDQVETLKDKLKNWEELTKERDSLANRVHVLEQQLQQYQTLPEDVELLRKKSDMLDNVMQERDGLSQKVKLIKSMEEEMQNLRAKADRVDQLERELKNMSKGDRSSGCCRNCRSSNWLTFHLVCCRFRAEEDPVQSGELGSGTAKHALRAGCHEEAD